MSPCKNMAQREVQQVSAIPSFNPAHCNRPLPIQNLKNFASSGERQRKRRKSSEPIKPSCITVADAPATIQTFIIDIITHITRPISSPPLDPTADTPPPPLIAFDTRLRTNSMAFPVDMAPRTPSAASLIPTCVPKPDTTVPLGIRAWGHPGRLIT